MSTAHPRPSIPAGQATRYMAAGAQTERGRSPEAHPRALVRTLEARVRRYNSDIRTDSATFRAAVLLLAAVELGQNIDILTRRTGYDRAFVAKCARRLIDNGVWVAGRTQSDWSPEDEASGAFWNDVAVAEGKLCRRTGPEGRIEWAPAGYWNKSYDFVGPGREDALSNTYRDPAAEPAAEDEPEDGAPSATAEHDSGDESEPTADPEQPGRVPPPESEQPRRIPPGTELFPDAVWLG